MLMKQIRAEMAQIMTVSRKQRIQSENDRFSPLLNLGMRSKARPERDDVLNVPIWQTRLVEVTLWGFVLHQVF